MKRLQDGFRVAFGDAEEGTGCAFRTTMALLPVLQCPRADADERDELTHAQINGAPGNVHAFDAIGSARIASAH